MRIIEGYNQIGKNNLTRKQNDKLNVKKSFFPLAINISEQNDQELVKTGYKQKKQSDSFGEIGSIHIRKEKEAFYLYNRQMRVSERNAKKNKMKFLVETIEPEKVPNISLEQVVERYRMFRINEVKKHEEELWNSFNVRHMISVEENNKALQILEQIPGKIINVMV
ncbi:MAG: hypothetical protein KAX49_10975 [Halanaerobiales bacterium]|nr:hypothetical protein [Halanaerobiales bacterium]